MICGRWVNGPRILAAANFPSWRKGTKAELDKNEMAGFWKWEIHLLLVFFVSFFLTDSNVKTRLQHSFYPANHKDSQKATTELIHRWWIWSFEGPGGTVWIFVSFLCCQGGKNILSQKPLMTFKGCTAEHLHLTLTLISAGSLQKGNVTGLFA